MSTWKEDEVNIVKQRLRLKNGTLTKEDFDSIQQQIPTRSVAAIKKKYLELKNNGETRTVSSRWSQEETDRLIRAYVSRTETQVTKRVQAILNDFPGRTLKGIATKLRDQYPDIYYMRNSTPEPPTEQHSDNTQYTLDSRPDTPDNTQEQTDHTEIQTNHEENIKGDETRTINPPEPTTTTSYDSHYQRSSRTCNQNSEVNQSPGGEVQNINSVPPDAFASESDEFSVNLRQKFDRMIKSIGNRKEKIRKFHLRPTNSSITEKVNNILEGKITQIEDNTQNEVEKRKRIKNAIYIAGILLRKTVLGKNEHRRPKYLITEKKIKKLNNHIKNARELVEKKGEKLSRRLMAEVKMMKKLKLTPRQYIKSTEERAKILEAKLEEQKKRGEINDLRARFQSRPSIETLRSSNRRTSELTTKDTEHFFQDLYRQEKGNTPTPIFNKFLRELKSHARKSKYENQLERRKIEQEVDGILKNVAPWKAPGEDRIPAYIYKVLPAARNYLKRQVTRLLNNETKLHEADVRANVILVHKSGDETNPANYRPISLLNVDYKITTAVIASMIKRSLPDFAIPAEQLARDQVWGTVHGLLLDKSITAQSKLNRTKNYSAWYDAKKAYDSVHHRCLKRLIDCLPLHRHIRNLLKRTVKLWSLRVQLEKIKTRPIKVQRGLLQGDSMSPILFVLMIASAILHIRSNPQICKETRGKHQLIAFMDDFKCHSPTESGIKLITEQLIIALKEIGLELNTAKCGIYSRDATHGPHEEINTPFLPLVKEGYKYLGLEQLERDTAGNFEKAQEKLEESIDTILQSDLTTTQKVYLINSTAVPAVVYVTANAYPDEKRSTTLKRCRDLDTLIRKRLIQHKMKGTTASNSSVYLPIKKGGLGIRSVEHQTEISFVKKGIYLTKNQEMAKCCKTYEQLKEAGWRNPLSDMEFVLEKYGVTVQNEENIKKCCKDTTTRIIEVIHRRLQEDWSRNMHYGKLVNQEGNNISFPAYSSPFLDTWRRGVLMSATEEQLHGLGSLPMRRNCRRGCNHAETAYHVSASCICNEYTTRHDNVVYWTLKTLLTSLRAPNNYIRNLQFGQSTCRVDFEANNRKVSIQAGQKLLTERRLYHNKPDILVKLTNPSEIFIIEVAVSHIQNWRNQERLKRTRYAVNSVKHITEFNLSNTTRDLNIVTELGATYRCPVKLAIFVVGCYGELIATDEHKQFCEMMKKKLQVSNRSMRNLLNHATYSVAVSTSNLLMKRLNEPTTCDR
ncbi:uncharacterized protein LOC123310990 [Coccinella septempunctata]|uniref:uncharacterized protein LOC123310990 n=1 Tax=Coccinella septempunctata TaxID=41139 RepID=UPI001D073FC5|nr:uncharacterized protein LOC123310990 [Coccinella septempunctata]